MHFLGIVFYSASAYTSFDFDNYSVSSVSNRSIKMASKMSAELKGKKPPACSFFLVYLSLCKHELAGVQAEARKPERAHVGEVLGTEHLLQID